MECSSRSRRWPPFPRDEAPGARPRVGRAPHPAASGEEAATKLRNVYRVLLTRGMRGTQLFILDAETRAHVESFLRGQRATRVA
ncbi:DUF2075 domain-containing protein [Archangium violaceum]|nr:DUF2075 domain-containing protein [Archangium violaceum]